MGEIANKVQERRLKWYGHAMRREEHFVGRWAMVMKVQERRLKWYVHVMRREEHYVGRWAMVMKVQVRSKRGRYRRRWLDKVKDDIKEKGCRLMMCTTVLHGGVHVIVHRPHIQLGIR